MFTKRNENVEDVIGEFTGRFQKIKEENDKKSSDLSERIEQLQY